MNPSSPLPRRAFVSTLAGAAVVLGGVDVSPLELGRAYTALLNTGRILSLLASARKAGEGDAGLLRASQGLDLGRIAAHGDDLGIEGAGRGGVDQALQQRARARGEHDDAGGHARTLSAFEHRSRRRAPG